MGGALSTSSNLSLKQNVSLQSSSLSVPIYTSDTTSGPLMGGDGVQGFSGTDQLVDLRGQSLELRPLTPADYESVKALRERNADTIAEVAVPREAFLMATETPEAFEAWWQMSEHARAAGTDFSFGIFEGDELIGEINLEAIRRGPYESAFLTAYIDQARTRNNKIEEAWVLLCKFAFDDLGLNRVECAVLESNQAVRRALEKVGVTSEGVARDYLYAGGDFRDHHRYVITAADWTERGKLLLSEWAGI